MKTQKMNMAEKTEQQQHLIDKQPEELQAMKEHIKKLRTVNLQTQNSVHDTILELEERNEEAERRAQDLWIRVLQLSKNQNPKNESCGT